MDASEDKNVSADTSAQLSDTVNISVDSEDSPSKTHKQSGNTSIEIVVSEDSTSILDSTAENGEHSIADDSALGSEADDSLARSSEERLTSTDSESSQQSVIDTTVESVDGVTNGQLVEEDQDSANKNKVSF